MLIGRPSLRGLGDCSLYPSTAYEVTGSCYDEDGDLLGLDPDYIATPAVITPVSVTTPTPIMTGPTPSPGELSQPVVTSYPAGNTAAQNASLLAAITAAGDKALLSTTTPYLIPGTNSVYNPATGAITTAASTPAALAAASALSTSALTSSMIPVAMIAVAGLLVVMMVSKK
jgi:hypothetical protein